MANVAVVSITHVSPDKIEQIARRVASVHVDVSVPVAGVSSAEAVFMEVSVPPGCAGFDAWDAR